MEEGEVGYGLNSRATLERKAIDTWAFLGD